MRLLRWCGVPSIALMLACPGDDGSASSTTMGTTSMVSSGPGDTTVSTTANMTGGTTAVGTEGASTSATTGSESSATTGPATSGDTTAGSDTGELGLVPCGTEEPPCPAGSFCQMSGCCFDVGVCVLEGTTTCDELNGVGCDGGLSCLQDACINEQPGACLPPELVDEICMLQSIGCWTICPVP